MLDRRQHELVLKNIIRDIYTTTNLESHLAFKGGTALYLFYGLDRFSVDLDFNLIGDNIDIKSISQVVSHHLKKYEYFDKRYTLLWIGSYADSNRKVKIEINKRDFGDTYQPLNFYGLTVPVMTQDCMFAHKLCAIKDRSHFQNRDLYDAHFMFKNHFPINEDTVKIRTGKSLLEYLQDLIEFIEQVDEKNILQGLGELLDTTQIQHIKMTLKRDLILDLKLYLDSIIK